MDMSDGLEEIFATCGVDANLSSAILMEGWNLTNFAVCASSLDKFDEVLPELCASFGDPTLIQKANLRAAFRMAQAKDPIPKDPGPSGGQASGSQDGSSWNEAFAPKLESQVIQKLRSTFLANYPSELLNPDVMPSTRLLSLVYDQLQKKNWKWIPWRYRMSVSKAEEISGQRAQKLPKIEGMTLHNLLVDDVPSLEINASSMGVNAIRNMLEVHDRAIAICQGAHLANLKAYTHKFVSFLTQKVDAETGLRNANVVEAQAADRQIWAVISELLQERGWNLDDSLHEMTHIRHDLPGLLQLRPRMPKSISFGSPSPFNRGDSGKGKGKSKTRGPGNPKGGSKGKGKVQWITEIKKDGQWRQLCMRYQTGKCSLSNCQFVHACAYPVDGNACGLEHGALAHRNTAH